MKKRVLSSILALCMVLVLLPAQALAVESGDQYFNEALYWSLNDAGVLTIKKNPGTESTNFSMPDYQIYSEKPWNEHLADISAVVIEDGVTSVGEYVFYGCSNLTSVTIPSSVTEIGANSFANCSKLDTINFSEGVTSIGNSAFSGCSKLASVSLPESLISIGKKAFSSTPLTTITIPASVTNIGGGAFSGCNTLTDIQVADGSVSYRFADPCLFALDEAGNPTTLSICLSTKYTSTYNVPETVTCIDDCAFQGCTYLRTLTLPPNLQTIGESAFYNCVGLSQLDIPDTVTSIGPLSFSNCKFDIQIPGSVKAIGQNFFSSSQAKNITLSEGFAKIGNNSLTGCRNLQCLTLPSSLKEIEVSSMNFNVFKEGGKIQYAGSAADWRTINIAVLNAGFFAVPIECNGKESHKIIYDPNGAKGLSNTDGFKAPTLFDDNDTSIILKAPTVGTDYFQHEYNTIPTGGKFLGWLIDGTLYKAGETYSVAGVTEDITAKAIWFEKDIPIKVTLNYQDSVTPDGKITCMKGSAYGTALPEPSRTGYRFDGWYTAAKGGTKVDSTSTAAQDCTLYAHWVQQYTVTFDANGGTMADTNTTITVEAGEVYTARGTWPTPPTREGYTFDGWYTEAEGGTKVNDTDTVPQVQDHTLYAHWAAGPAKTFTVTFDPSSGSVSTTSKEVTEHQPYGELPTPTRSSYRFDGWYTAADGGSKITSESQVNLTADQTLYAHWVQQYTVTFDANGGTIGSTSITVEAGKAYNAVEAWPTTSPIREKHRFDGWYTAAEGGTKVEATTTVTQAENHILYAHWTRTEFDPVTVTFDSNGGSAVTPATITAEPNKAYNAGGSWPTTPTKDGYVFDGWYTEAEGGTKVLATDVVRQTEDHTLYAHWTQDYIALLSFGFANSGGDFGYKTGYRIPYTRYKLIYGDTALAKQMYEWSGPWGGSCGGMAALSGLFYLPNTLDFQDFRRGPNDTAMPSQLSNIRPDYRSNSSSAHQRDISLRGLVEAMQLDQGCCLSSKGLGYSLNNLWDAVDSFYQTGKNPVRISVRNSSSGHALVGYRVEAVNDTEGRIYVYDCNAPLSQNAYITLKKDTPEGEYTKWSYHNYDKSISFSINNGRVPTWLSKTEQTTRAVEALDTIDPTMELLLVNSDQAEVRNSSGQVVAKVTDGITQAEKAGVFPVNIVSELASEPAGSEFTAPTEDTNIKAVWVPVGQYTVENKDESMGEDFQATMVHVEQAASITTSGDVVSFVVNDGTGSSDSVNYVRLADPNATYEICLETSDVPGNQNHYKEIRMSGQSTGEAVSFAQVDDGLYMDGAPVEQTKYEVRLDGDQYADIDLEEFDGNISDYEVPTYSEKVPWTDTTAADAQVQEKMPDNLSATVVDLSVTFDANGGTGTMEVKSAVKGMPFAMPACSFTPPAGKTFDRWAVGTVNGEKVTAGDFYTFTENTTVYALWKDKAPSSSGSGSGNTSSGSSITTKSSGNGSVKLSSTQAPKGTSVTISIHPDAGYTLDTLTVLDSKGNRITVTEQDGKYSFIMPEGSVSVEATFRSQSEEDVNWTNPFVDVDTTAWYYDAVKYVNQKNLMNGMEGGAFQPNLPLSRAMMVQILYNRAGRPDVSGTAAFPDVAADAWHAAAVIWAGQNGLVAGYGDGTFHPDEALTREQLAVILWRYAGSLSANGDLSQFSDNDDVSAFAVEAVRWASSNNILMGTDGKIDPKGIAQRAHVAAMLMRYLESTAE